MTNKDLLLDCMAISSVFGVAAFITFLHFMG